MNSNSDADTTIALAAIFQAAQCVTDLSKTGICDQFSYKALIDSLFILEPASTLDIYEGDIRNLEPGLSLLLNLSEHRFNPEFADCTRYALSMIAVQKKMTKNTEMMNTISHRLKHMQFNQQHFAEDSSDLASRISSLYQDSISTLAFRIRVTGNMQHLTETLISDKIRVMLFAGIRATMLWRQLGGSKLQLLFGRSRIEKQCQLLLQEINALPKH